MGKTGAMGSFEEMVLLAVLHQGDSAYGVSVRRELAERSGSDIAMGAVYATLERLEEKGLVTVRDGRPDGSRRGRPRRYYRLLPAGVAALEETRRVRASMWEDVDLDAVDAGRAG